MFAWKVWKYILRIIEMILNNWLHLNKEYFTLKCRHFIPDILNHSNHHFRPKVYTKPAKRIPKQRRNVQIDDSKDVVVNVTTPKTTRKRDIELPKSKQEVFKIFDLSTTNQILQVCTFHIFGNEPLRPNLYTDLQILQRKFYTEIIV